MIANKHTDQGLADGYYWVRAIDGSNNPYGPWDVRHSLFSSWPDIYERSARLPDPSEPTPVRSKKNRFGGWVGVLIGGLVVLATMGFLGISCGAVVAGFRLVAPEDCEASR